MSGPVGSLVRIWAAECDSATQFTSIASVNPGIGFVRARGVTTVHLRGPATEASPLSCPKDSEYFGVDFRLGAFFPDFPPAGLANLQDAMVPVLSDGRMLLGGMTWEIPTPDNVDVFTDRLKRAGLLTFDPLVEELQHVGQVRGVAERTAQDRFVRAVGLSRRTLRLIERTRHAARLIRMGVPIVDVVSESGFYDQPHLTRSVRRLIGHTPVELARGGFYLDL